MGIVTKSGDKGRTRLVTGEEVVKSDPRLEACGIIDEINCQIGLARALTERYGDRCGEIAREIQELQLDLYRLATELSCCEPGSALTQPTTAEHVRHIEKRIAALERSISLPRAFIIPGASEASAAMDVARAIARRLERRAAVLAEQGSYANEQGLIYLNRLSDYLFLLARAIEQSAGIAFHTKEGG